MGRKKKLPVESGKPIALGFSLDGAIVKMIDEEVERLDKTRPGFTHTRTEVLRGIMNAWAAERKKAGR